MITSLLADVILNCHLLIILCVFSIISMPSNHFFLTLKLFRKCQLHNYKFNQDDCLFTDRLLFIYLFTSLINVFILAIYLYI